MQDGMRFTIIAVVRTGVVERKSALKDKPDGLFEFMAGDEFLSRLPDTDKDVVRGPAELLQEFRYPLMDVREMLRQGSIEIVLSP